MSYISLFVNLRKRELTFTKANKFVAALLLTNCQEGPRLWRVATSIAEDQTCAVIHTNPPTHTRGINNISLAHSHEVQFRVINSRWRAVVGIHVENPDIKLEMLDALVFQGDELLALVRRRRSGVSWSVWPPLSAAPPRCRRSRGHRRSSSTFFGIYVRTLN